MCRRSLSSSSRRSTRSSRGSIRRTLRKGNNSTWRRYWDVISQKSFNMVSKPDSPSHEAAPVLLFPNDYLLWLLILHTALRWAITLGWAISLRRSVVALRRSIANRIVSVVVKLSISSRYLRFGCGRKRFRSALDCSPLLWVLRTTLLIVSLVRHIV